MLEQKFQEEKEVPQVMKEISHREIARVGRFALREITYNVPKEAVKEVSTREICHVGRFVLTETTYEIETIPESSPLCRTPYINPNINPKTKRE